MCIVRRYPTAFGVLPIAQANPAAATNAPATIDPVKRYLHFEKAFEAGELDPNFDRLSV